MCEESRVLKENNYSEHGVWNFVSVQMCVKVFSVDRAGVWTRLLGPSACVHKERQGTGVSTPVSVPVVSVLQ